MKNPFFASVITTAVSSGILIAAPDTVDQNFADTAGQVFASDQIGGIASSIVQPDGKVIFGSNEMPGMVGGNQLQIPLIRFNQNGSVDSTFGADNAANAGGTGIVFFSPGFPETHALALQPDGKIIAAGVMEGYSANGTSVTHGGMSIVRFNADGTPDPTFQTRGTVQGGGLNYINDVEVQPDGKILAAGGFAGVRNADNTYFPRRGVVRFNSDGTVDAGFTAEPSIIVNSFVRDVELSPDGKIYLSTGQRLNPDGSLDTTFTPQFSPTPPAGTQFDSVDLDSEGRLLYVGTDFSSSTVQRFFTDGTKDTTFTLDPSLGVVSADQLEETPAGQYYLITIGSSNRDRLVRINADGALDPTFNALSDHPDAPFGASKGFFSNVSLSPDGSVYSGAYFSSVNGVSTKKIVKFTGDNVPGATGTISAPTALSVVEENTTLNIPITRVSGITGAASVNYAVVGQTASAGSDFTASSGTLTWAAGTGGAKFISIPVLADAVTEGNETFRITLSGATGAALGTRSQTIVTILDDDQAPVVTLAPVPVQIVPGQNIRLSVRGSSARSISYQWERNGIPVLGATSANFIGTESSLANSGDQYTVVLTNNFGSVETSPVSVTVISKDGARDLAFNPTGLGVVQSTFTLSDGRTIVSSKEGNNIRMRRILADGTTDPSFEVIFTRNNFGGATANAIRELPSGSILVSGLFETAGGLALSGTSSTQISITPQGTVDPRPVTSGAYTDSAGRTYRFEQNGPLAGIRRYSAEGELDSGFSSSLGAGTSGSVSIFEDSSGRLMVYSQFIAGGSFVRYLNRLNGDGSRDLTFSRVSFSATPSFTRSLADGRIIYAVGSTLGMVDERGVPSPGFQAPVTTGRIYSGVLEYAGSIFVWGSGPNGPFFERLSYDGSVDPNFPPAGQPDGPVSNVTIAPTGGLIVAGSFSRFNDGDSPGLIKLVVDDRAVRFTKNVIRTFENEGSVQVGLVRSGNSSGATSVTVRSLPGTATSPAHFTAVNQSVSWAAGESGLKNVTVSLVNDAASNPLREFSLEIVGSPASPPVRIEILDDESGPLITSQPVPTETVIARSVRLEVGLASAGGATFRWLRDGVVISGATSAFYDTAIEGTYQVEITRGGMTVLSDPVGVAVKPDPTQQNFTFSPGILPSNFDVRVVKGTSDGGVFVGGNSPSGNRHVFRFQADGTDVPLPGFLSGTVNAIAIQPDGKTIVGGLFTLSGLTTKNVIRFNADNTIDSSFATAIGNGPNGEVLTIAVSPDGHIALGGTFGGRLSVLRPDGSAETGFSATNTPSNGVKAILALPDNSFAVAGIGSDLRRYSATGAQIFSTALPVNHLALAANGDLIAGLNATRTLGPVTGAVARVTQAGVLAQVYPVPAAVLTVGVQSDGKILAGGGFSSADAKRLVRLTTAGTIDPLFLVPQFNSNISNNVTTIDPMPDGRIWIGGAILGFNGGKRVALLNGDPVKLVISKQPVTQFKPAGQPVTLSVETFGVAVQSYQWFRNGQPLAGETARTLSIASLAEANEGTYFCEMATVVGTFRSSSAFVGLLAAPKIRTAPASVESPDGFRVVLSADAYGQGALSYQWLRNGTPVSDSETYQGSNSSVLVISNVAPQNAGDFTVRVSNSLGNIVSDPATLTIFQNQGAVVDGFTQPQDSFGASVRTIATLPGTSAIVGGSFFRLRSGVNNSGSNIAVINSDGSVRNTPDLTANNIVDKILVLPGGKILVAGRFTTLNGQTINQIARLNTDFSLDTTFDPGTTFPGSRQVTDLAIDRDGKIMVAVSDVGLNYLVRLDANGSRDTGFVSTANNPVNRVIPRSDGGYLLGGRFSNWDGTGSTTDSYIILVNSNGSLNSSTDYLQTGIVSHFLFERGDGSLVTGSNSLFLELLGANGSPDSAFFADLLPNGLLETFLEDSSGDMYLGGAFSTINGVSRNRLMKLKPGAGSPTIETRFDIGTGFNNTVRALALAENGELWVGGDFTQLNGSTTVRFITRLKNESQPPAGPESFAEYIGGFTLPAGQEGFDADPDGDGLDNGIEYLLGGNPGALEQNLLPPGQIRTGVSLGLADSNSYFTLSVSIREELAAVDWSVQATEDLLFVGGQTAVQVGQPTDANGKSTYLFRCPWPTNDPRGRGFLRLRLGQ